MNTLIFVSISVMSCYGNVLTTKGSMQRCEFGQEMIVKADQLSVMRDKQYLLGPISRELQVGCQVTLANGEYVMSGKPCRKLIGAK